MRVVVIVSASSLGTYHPGYALLSHNSRCLRHSRTKLVVAIGYEYSRTTRVVATGSDPLSYVLFCTTLKQFALSL